ncbi:MAG: 50S ribosomal protein L21 [Actinomycetes bacterium]|nr:50S ribosomal protein L21 [Candidatus Nanopelagicales bacterium]MDP4824807.1 50S ribosomal protein L21 [Candidatus Nanopelagicales bacterium]MDP4887381.1 50S ribosomal protein L21 [Candidatus Nanopelagicales bacterium]MDP5095845.1 50S ribosomal protein L21 [Candidatus Nanopelagicales bacterium]
MAPLINSVKPEQTRGVPVYAIVRAGGRQEKVAVGDVVVMDRVHAEPGATVSLPAVLVVDDGAITASADALAQVAVDAEVLNHERGPKIRIIRYKNKTGYRRRMGHRQDLTRVKVTSISSSAGK